jgi:cytochrome b561
MPTIRYLDVLVVAVVGVPALALGAPAFGYLVGGGAWIVTRVLQANRYRWVSKIAKSDAMRRAAANMFEAFGRIWLLAIAIIVAGVVGKRADGLTAALVIFGAYSIAFAIRLVSGPPTGEVR